MLAYLAVHGFAVFLAAVCTTTAMSQASGGVRGALVLGLTEDKMGAMASLRVANHVGVALGAVLAGAVIAVGTRGAYAALVLLNAATFVGYAALVASVPRVAPVPRREGPALTVLRDRPYMTLAAMTGVLSLCWGMLSSGVPLWIVRHTHASPSLGAAIVIINSVFIAAFQVRVARGIETPLRAARGAFAAGALLAGSCVLFALTAGLGGPGATVCPSPRASSTWPASCCSWPRSGGGPSRSCRRARPASTRACSPAARRPRRWSRRCS
jgi:hypothetical protein